MTNATDVPRYTFTHDDDGHWFLIPVSMVCVFRKMLAEGEADYWTLFNNTFDEYLCDSPSNYTFENPFPL